MSVAFTLVAVLAASPSVSDLDAALSTRATLEAAQALARAQHPGLRAVATRAEAQRALVEARGAWPSPQLGAAAWNTPSSEPWNVYEARMLMVTLRQRLPSWGRGALREAQEATVAATEAERAALGLEVDRLVAKAFVDLQGAQARHAIHARHVEVLRQIAEVAHARLTSGGSLEDVAQAERELARLQAEVAAEAALVVQAQARLNALTGRAPDAPLGAPGEAPAETVTQPPAAMVARATGQRPELKEADAMSHRQRALATAARREATLPGVNVGLAYFPPTRMAPGHGVGLELGLELPWLWGGRATEADGQEALVRAAQEMEADAAYRVTVDVVSQLAQVRAATTAFSALRQTALPKATDAFEAAFAAYRSGQGDVLRVLSAEQAIIELDVALVLARTALDQALADLDWAVGERVPRSPVEAATP